MEWLEKQTPILSAKQLDRLSNIFDNVGQVVLGVVVLSPIISGIDEVRPMVIVLGLVATLFCWLFSIFIAKRGDKK